MKAHAVGEDVTDRFLHPVVSDHVAAAASAPEEATVALYGDESGRHAPTKGVLHAFLFGSGTRTGVTATAIVGLIGVAVTIIIATSTSGGVPEIVTSGKTEIVTSRTGTTTPPPAPTGIASAADLRKYVLSRSMWQTTPTTFSDSLGIAFNQQYVSGGPALAAVDNGEASAYSVPELISDGASLTGEPIYVVGRVVSSVQSPVGTDDWTTEAALDIVLSGPSGPDRVYALASSGYSAVQAGDVVFFRAVVAAVGTAIGGRPTAYVISLEDPESTATFGATHTDTVAGLARQFGRSALP